MSEPAESHEEKGKRGTTWTLLGYAGRHSVRMASNLILTRLLVPEFFGTMLVVNTVILGIHLFTDVGIGPSIIQNERGDEPAFLNTAFTLQAFRGLLLFAAVGLIAVPVAEFYDDPILRTLLPFAGLSALFQGLYSTRIPSHRRHVQLKQLTLLLLLEQVLATLVMVGWALMQPTVWALAAGGVIASAVTMLLSHFVLEGPRNRLQIEKAAMHELIRFGRWIFLSTLLTYLVSYSDRLIITKLMPLEVAGVYSIAVMIADLPAMPLASIAADVAFPIFSRVHSEEGDLLAMFRSFRRSLNTVGGWAVAGLLAGAPVAVEMLWTEPYWGAGWMVQVLIVGVYVGTILVASNNAALLAMGHSRLMAATGMAKLVGMAALIPAGYLSFGLPGLLAGFAGSQIFPYLLSLWGVSQFGLNDLREDLVAFARVLVTGAVGYGVGYALVDAGAPRIVAATALAAVVTLLWWSRLGPLVKRVRAGGSPFEFDGDSEI